MLSHDSLNNNVVISCCKVRHYYIADISNQGKRHTVSELIKTFFFYLLLYIQGKQLRSCPEGQYPNYTFPGHAFNLSS